MVDGDPPDDGHEEAPEDLVVGELATDLDFSEAPSISEVEFDLIEHALMRHDGDEQAAADELGISLDDLRRRREKNRTAGGDPDTTEG